MIRKFRAWDKPNKNYWNNHSDSFVLSLEGKFLKMISGDDGGVEAINEVSDERFLFEQCIGREDKNGHVLFEGDIVMLDVNEYLGIKYPCEAEMVWSDDKLGWVGITEEFGQVDLSPGINMEIVGNKNRRVANVEKTA